MIISLYHVRKEIKYKFFKYYKHLEVKIMILESGQKDISDDVFKNVESLIVLMTKRLLKNKKISILL